MKKISCYRTVIGGALAGLIMFILEGLINGVILADDWKSWISKMSGTIEIVPASTAMTYWFLQSIVLGIAGVWIYASIRPRFGAGPKTAVFAGLFVWVTAWGARAFEQKAFGHLTDHLCAINLIGGLPVAVIAILAGAWLYKE